MRHRAGTIPAEVSRNKLLLHNRPLLTAEGAEESTLLPTLEVGTMADPAHDTEDEVLNTSALPTDPRTCSTGSALGTPGNTASYKLYVITATGNERGSNAVTITRLA